MPSRSVRAVELTKLAWPLAVVSLLGSVLSFSKIAQALASQGDFGMAFPLPTGLPLVWTYVSLPTPSGGTPIFGPLDFLVAVPLFLIGLLVTSALEAGFLAVLQGHLEGAPTGFFAGVWTFTWRMIGVNVIRFAVVLVAIPLLILPPVALVVVIGLLYLIYGLPFEVVGNDVGIGTALGRTIARAASGGPYAAFGLAHLAAGTAVSIPLTYVVLNGDLVGIVLGAGLVSVPAVFVASYGLLVIEDTPPPTGSARAEGTSTPD